MPISAVPTEVTISGDRYRISLLPLSKGRPLVRIAAAIMSRMAGALHNSKVMDEEGNVDMANLGIADIGSAVAAAMDVITDSEMARISDLIAMNSEVCVYGEDGQERWARMDKVMETHFAGNVVGWGMWVFHNMKLNAGDFLSLTQSMNAGGGGGA